jgi:hypothetical protein
MEALLSSETSVLTNTTQRNIPEDGILHGGRLEHLIRQFPKFSRNVARTYLFHLWKHSRMLRGDTSRLRLSFTWYLNASTEIVPSHFYVEIVLVCFSLGFQFVGFGRHFACCTNFAAKSVDISKKRIIGLYKWKHNAF